MMKVTRTVSGLEVELASERDTQVFGRALARIIEPGTVIGLIGPLGAGKTQLARAVAEELGADPAAIASPTFVLIHEYEGRLPVYHFDVYRLSSREAFEDLGPADYWDAGGVCLVEWADRFPGLLPEGSWTIRLEPRGRDRRHLALEVPSGDSARLDPLAVFDRGPDAT